MNTLLIWDIDGTLINCKGVGRKALNRAFEKLYGIPSGFDDITMAGRLDEMIIRDAMTFHKLKEHDIVQFYSAYGEALVECMEIHKPYVHKGVLSILKYTEASGKVLNAVGTGNCRVGADLKLEYTGLKSYMKLGGYGSDHEQRHALIQDVIAQAKQKYGQNFNHDSIYVIGDTPRDVIAGQKNNVKTIAVETGGYSREDLIAYNPDYILESLENTEAFLRSIQLHNGGMNRESN